MKAETAHEKNEKQLLIELDSLMREKRYAETRLMFIRYPNLIHGLTPKCEVPLVMAIHHWDPLLVRICIEHGADSREFHQCSKDGKRKIPILILNHVLSNRLQKSRSDNAAMDRDLDIYYEMMRYMQKRTPFPKGSDFL